MKLSDMQGLGPKSEQQLIAIGITTPDELIKIGPVAAYLKLHSNKNNKVSLNFLYALVGAVENIHWQTVAQTEKSRLIQELEGYKELRAQLDEEGIKFEW